MTYPAGEYGPPTTPRPRPRPRPYGLKPLDPAPCERWSCMKKAPRLGMKAGSSSRFFLYSSCSRRRRSANVSCFAGVGCEESAASWAGASGAGGSAGSSSKSTAAASCDIFKPFIMASVSEIGPALTLAGGAAGWPFGGRGAPFLVATDSLSLRSLASASASSSLKNEASLCESPRSSSVASSASRLRRLTMARRGGAMVGERRVAGWVGRG